METIVKNGTQLYKEKISQGCNLHRFFKNKIYTGIDHELLTRKVYRGKRNIEGKRKNEFFYVNADQSFRIEETLLIDKVDEVLEAITQEEDIEVNIKGKQSAIELFNIMHHSIVKNEDLTIEEYKEFINKCLNEADNQTFKNMKIRREIETNNFKDIIEEIEVYETGIVCIFNNGLEMAVQF